MSVVLRLLLLFSSLITLSTSSTSFCKCSCGANSTIIPLDAPPSTFHSPPSPRSLLLVTQRSIDNNDDDTKNNNQTSPPDSDKENNKKQGSGELDDEDRKEYRKKTCNDCNRQYCLDQRLHICEGKGMDEVFTTCFQRDSQKDEAVVYIFIVATVGLLLWALLKPWVGRWVKIKNARVRRSYNPVPREGDEG